MALQRVKMTRGDTHIFTLLFKNGTSGLPYCLKNWSVFFTMKTDPSLPDSQAVLQKIITDFPDTTAGTSGLCSVPLAPADTVNLEPGEYDFDIAITTAANENFTVMKGKLDLQYDVTRSIGTAGTAT